MKKTILACACFALLCGSLCAAQDLKQIGVVAALELSKTTGKEEPSFQQTVWMNALNYPKRFALKVIEEETLASPEKLAAFSAIVVPSTRLCLSAAQMDALKTYVKQGGKLVRDGGAAGSLDTDKFSPASTAAAGDFWKEVSGAQVDSRFINYAGRFRFAPEFARLSRDLPDKFTEGDIPAENRLARTMVYYKLVGASAVAEAEVMRIDSWDNWKGEAKPLDGAKPVICLNKYGKGACLSTGMSFPRAIYGCYGNISCDLYRTFHANLIAWCLE